MAINGDPSLDMPGWAVTVRVTMKVGNSYKYFDVKFPARAYEIGEGVDGKVKVWIPDLNFAGWIDRFYVDW